MIKDWAAASSAFDSFSSQTKELEPFTLHLNLRYMRNNSKNDEKKYIAHASLAGEWKIMRKLRLVANAGIETCKDRSYVNDPAFILGGLICSITDKIDIDVGIKHGITRTENDFTALAGITIRF
ncbi:MAG: transporter [Proteobacteria bacterium]|nr:transporter [Pseudomonadota bacterium]